MGFENFRLQVVLRVLALLGNGFVLLWGWLNTDWQVTLAVSAVVLLLQAVELVYCVERSNRMLTSFLNSVAERDFSTRFSGGGQGEGFESMAAAYNRIMEEMAFLNSEREARNHLLSALVEHVSVALLCLDASQHIVLMNEAAKRLFGCPYLQNAHALGRVNAELPELVAQARDGESGLVTLELGGRRRPLSMFTTRFQLQDEDYLLASFQDIGSELETQEVESWQQLIRVLTHEIMNSMTPIVSLSSVVHKALVSESNELRAQLPDNQQRDDLVRSLNAITQRSRGLMHFVQSYKSLASPPVPSFSDIRVAGLLDRVVTLLRADLEAQGISTALRCQPEHLLLQADQQQLEQVLINLLKNACEAIAGRENGHIVLAADRNTGGDRVRITVEDNGCGIAAEHLQDIFVPFYTSKKGGTGVGLSICRQLMLANRGTISCSSTPGTGTVFTLSFPALGA